jgi:hypothetical protein
MTRKRTLVTVGLALLVVLAGCASVGSDGDVAGGSDDGGEAFATSGDNEEMDAAGDGGDGGGDAATSSSQGGSDGDGAGGGQAAVRDQPAAVDRAIIRTGTVELRVEEFAAARAAIADRARSHGGYVSGSGSTHHTRDNQSWTAGYVVVRVPSEQFSEVLSDTRARGTVLNEETRTRDVTDQLVDIEARLTNLRERRDRLRSFYEQANSTAELLRIEEELSSVQSDIEQLEAKQRSLEQQVAFATLRVELNEPEPDRTPGEDPAFTASLASAFLGSVGSLADMVTGFVLFVARLAPFLLFLGVPALGVGLLARRRFVPDPAPTTDRPGRNREQATPDEDATAHDDSSTPGTDDQPDSE